MSLTKKLTESYDEQKLSISHIGSVMDSADFLQKGAIYVFSVHEKGMGMKRMVSWVAPMLVFSLWSCDSGYSGSSSEAPFIGGESAQSVAYRRPTINGPAPAFRLLDLEGKAHSLGAYKGKVVFLNFWATWCGPCKVEMPAMEALYQSFRPRVLKY